MPATFTDRLNGLTTSVAVKAPARAATTAAISLSGLQTVDGVVLAAGDRVLVKDQTDPVDNGIYIATSGTWVRTPDFDGSLDVVGGTLLKVNQGTINANTYWEIQGNGQLFPGSDAIVIIPTSGNITLEADLLAPTGAGKVGYDNDLDYADGTVGAALVVAENKLARFLCVTDDPFNAAGDGAADDLAAFNAALAVGGTIRVPGPATYKCNGRLLVTEDNTTLILEAGVTLLIDGGTYNGTQNPFLNCIHITGENCSIIGRGPSSVIQNNASDANVVGWLHCGGGLIRDVALDGDRDNVPAIAEDTFQSGLSIVNTTDGSASDNPSNTVIKNVWIKNCTQYGLNFYGNLANGISINNVLIEDIGLSGDALSVGSGAAFTRAISELNFSNFTIRRCKLKGIFQSSAGEASSGFTISNFNISGCGDDGISFTEESNFGSASGIGTDRVSIGPGTITGSGNAGVKLGTYDNVGFLKNVSVNGVTATNGTYGILVQTNNDATNRVSKVTIGDCTLTGNSTTDLAIGPNNTTILHGNNTFDTVSDSQIVFTPTLKGSSSDGTATYSVQTGAFQKVGDNVVWFSVALSWSGHTGTGNMLVGGLPFTAATGDPSSIVVAAADGVSADGVPVGTIDGSSDVGIYEQVVSGGLLTLGPISMDAAGTLRLTGTFRI